MPGHLECDEISVTNALHGTDAPLGLGGNGGNLILRPGAPDGAGALRGIQVRETGNVRGAHATDFQTLGAAAEVASGARAALAAGTGNLADGDDSSAWGYACSAFGDNGSHAEGYGSIARGNGSHAEGFVGYTLGIYSHSEGSNTESFANYSHAEGYRTVVAVGATASHAEGMGYYNAGTTYGYVSGISAHGEGYVQEVLGQFAHAEGSDGRAEGRSSHTEGSAATATGLRSHAENSYVVGDNAHGEAGAQISATGDHAHAEASALADGQSSHASGALCTAEGDWTSILCGTLCRAANSRTSAMGLRAHTHIRGQMAQGANTVGAGFEGSQGGRTVLQAETTDVNPVIANIDSDPLLQIVIPTNSAFGLRVTVTARQTGGAGTGDSALWTGIAILKRLGNVTTILTVANLVMVQNDAGAATWTAVMTADDVNETLVITLTGENAKTIQWTLSARSSEVLT